MYMVFSIALSNAATLEARLTYLGGQIQGLFSGQPLGFEFQIFFSWTLIVVAVIIALTLGTALWATRRGEGQLRVREIVVMLLIALVVCLALIALEEITSFPSRTARTGRCVASVISNLPIVAAWVFSVVAIIALVVSQAAGLVAAAVSLPRTRPDRRDRDADPALGDRLRHQGDRCQPDRLQQRRHPAGGGGGDPVYRAVGGRRADVELEALDHLRAGLLHPVCVLLHDHVHQSERLGDRDDRQPRLLAGAAGRPARQPAALLLRAGDHAGLRISAADRRVPGDARRAGAVLAQADRAARGG